MCTKVRLHAGAPGLLSGSPRPLSTVPWPGSSGSGAGRAAGQPGQGNGLALLLFPPGEKPLADVTHGSATSQSSPWEEGSWCWHRHCGDIAQGLGGLGALRLMSLPVAHDSSTLAPICSG